MSAFPSPPPSLAPPAGRKRSLPFSLRIQTTPAGAALSPPPPFALGGISSPEVAVPAQGITASLSFDAPPPSAIEPSFSCFPPPLPALAPLPLPPHLRTHPNSNSISQPSPSSSSVPSLAGSPSATPSTAMSSTSSASLPPPPLLSLDPTRPSTARSGTFASRNPKNLSISLKPSWPSLNLQNPSHPPAPDRKRSNSVSLVLPYYSTANSGFYNSHSEEEEHDPPYPDGPVEILPKVWLGHEGHARDVPLLRERGIGWVLNVAKEVDLELGEEWAVMSMEEVAPEGEAMDVDSEPSTSAGAEKAEKESEKKIRYMKLPWSHGQQDLCEVGFRAAMSFVDRALASGESVLVHCQCGVSRSATLVMALVIRAGHLARTCGDAEHPMCRIVSHNDAYEYVQGKSRWVGPNIVLINQLVEYSKLLRTQSATQPQLGGLSQATDSSRSRTVSGSTDLSLPHSLHSLASLPEGVFSSSSSSASSSPGLASPPTPDHASTGVNPTSPKLGPESIEAMLLDKQMERQYEVLCRQRREQALGLARQGERVRALAHQGGQSHRQGLMSPHPGQQSFHPAELHLPSSFTASGASPRGLGLPPTPATAPLSSSLTPASATSAGKLATATSPLSPATPLSGGGRPSRSRASSAESALPGGKAPWNIGMLLRVEEES